MKNFILTTELDEIAIYMPPEISEKIHSKLAPRCTPREYILEYLRFDDYIKFILKRKGIDTTNLKELEDIDIRNLLLLENQILTQEEIDSLMLNQNVTYITDLGYSSYYKGYHWAELALFDGSIIVIYYE